MEKLTLIKVCPAVDLAHLYEHFWSTQLTMALQNEKLYEFIDYFQEIVTYNTGFIYIELYIKPEQEQLIRNCLQRIVLDTGENSISTAIQQIMAEKGYVPQIDWHSLAGSLQELHATPWIELKDFTFFDYQSAPLVSGAFYLTNKKVTARIIRTTFTLPASFVKDAESRVLLPLFYLVAYTLNYLVRETLTGTFGYYSYEDTSGLTAKGMVVNNMFRACTDNLKDIGEITTALNGALAHHLQVEFIEHISAVLSDPDYILKTYRMDESTIYKHTGILMGGKGWQLYASPKNIKRLLEKTTLTVASGREKETIRLV